MKKLNTKRNWIILGGILLIVILVVVAITKGKNSNATKVSTEKVEKRKIIQTVSANGKIQPEVDIKISPYISGEVVELKVKEGDIVKKGDLLAKIDPEIYISSFEQGEASLNTQKANLANARARLSQMKAQFDNTKASFERQEKLYKENVISASDYDAAKSAFQVAKAQTDASEQDIVASEYMVKSSEASLKRAREDLTKTAIYAPNDGKVSKLSVEIGERVTGASQFSSGTEIMRIANLNEMEAQVEVNENDIVRVGLGDTSLIEVDAYLGRKFKGVVTEIATAANTDGTSADQVTNFNVKIHILKDSYRDLIPADRPDVSPFRPGMSTTVDIQTETVYNAPSIPIQAVSTRSKKDTTYKLMQPDNQGSNGREEPQVVKDNAEDLDIEECVFVYVDGTVRMIKVKTGIQDNTYIQIKKGLKPGQEVVVAPYSAVSKKLKDKDKVKKVDKKDLFIKE